MMDLKNQTEHSSEIFKEANKEKHGPENLQFSNAEAHCRAEEKSRPTS